jgi:hypothetical protein
MQQKVTIAELHVRLRQIIRRRNWAKVSQIPRDIAKSEENMQRLLIFIMEKLAECYEDSA